MINRAAIVCVFLLFATATFADCLVPQWQTYAYSTAGNRTDNTIATADFDDDGHADVVTISLTNNEPLDRVNLRRGKGDLDFHPYAVVYESESLSYVIARDLNNDTKVDLLVGRSNGALIFLAGLGNGTFAAPLISTAPSHTQAQVADFNDDDLLDVALVVNENEGPDSLALLAGNGAGAFVEVHRRPLAAQAYTLAAGDLDGDSTIDVVVSYGDGTLALFYGENDGTFEAAPQSLSGGILATKIAIGDVEGDGDLDILTPDWDDATVSVHLNRGGRQFDARNVYVIPKYEDISTPNSLSLADMTGDGVLDILVGSVNGGFIGTLRGLGNGNFQPAVITNIHSNGFTSSVISQVVAVDLDEDGRLDVVTSGRLSGSLVVAHNLCGDISFYVWPKFPVISVGQVAEFNVQASVRSFPPRFAPTGAVSILENDVEVGTGEITGVDSTVTLAGLSAGEHSLVVRYHGDAQYEPTDAAPVVQRVTTETTSVTVRTDPSETVHGQPFFAFVDITSGDGSTLTGPTQTSIDGPSNTDLSLYPPGTYTVTSRFLGDHEYPPSEIATATHIVRKAESAIDPLYFELLDGTGSILGIAFTIRAKEHYGKPGGWLHLYDRDALIAMQPISPISTVVAFHVSNLTPGRHELRASYAGDGNYYGSESASRTHVVYASTALALHADGRANGVLLHWPWANDSRTVERSIGPDPTFTQGHTLGRFRIDQNAVEGVVYLYRLVAPGSPPSPVDLGVRMTFSEDPLLPGMRIKALHMQELIAATNFLRGKVGQSLVTLNDVNTGQIVRASHIHTLRAKINEARVALGAAPISFSRTIAVGGTIRAEDLQELRDAVH